jgi:hypothetical protein
MAVELLAQLMLQCAQADRSLVRRAPANDDGLHASIGGDMTGGDIPGEFADDMYSRIQALPELRTETPVSLPRMPAADVASNQELEEMVASALASAQDAEDISRRANAAGRKARRGTLLAIGMAAVGIAIATAGTIGARLLAGGDNQQMAEFSRQVQALGELQRHINDQLARLHAETAVREATAVKEASAVPAAAGMTPARHTDAVPPPLAPLKATFVRVLPEEPEPTLETAGQPSRPDPRTLSYAPSAFYAADSPGAPYAADPPAPPYVANGNSWAHHRRPVRHYRSQVVIPRPVAYFIVSVQHDVRALFP